MRSSGTPHRSRCWLIPSGTTNDRVLGPHQVVDRRGVEVVVVVVRDQHRAQLGQVVQRHRDRVVAPRTHAGRRRDPVAPHRVGEHPVPLELEEHGGVAEPGGGQLTGLGGKLRRDHLDGSARLALATLGGHLRGHPGRGPRRHLGRRQPVAEQAVAELRRVGVVELAHAGAQGASYAPGSGEHTAEDSTARNAKSRHRPSVHGRHNLSAGAPPARWSRARCHRRPPPSDRGRCPRTR